MWPCPRVSRGPTSTRPPVGVPEQAGLWIGPQDSGHHLRHLGSRAFAFCRLPRRRCEGPQLVPFFHGREAAWGGIGICSRRSRTSDPAHTRRRQVRPLLRHSSVDRLRGRLDLDKADAVVTPIQRLPGGRLRWADEGASGRSAGPAEGHGWVTGQRQPSPLKSLIPWPRTLHVPEVSQQSEKSWYSRGRRTESDVSSRRPSRTCPGVSAGLRSRSRPAAERTRPLHLFAAAPVALAFLIGRQAAPWGSTISYEYDFDTESPRGLHARIPLPGDKGENPMTTVTTSFDTFPRADQASQRNSGDACQDAWQRFPGTSC